jgi:hypothetical protein
VATPRSRTHTRRSRTRRDELLPAVTTVALAGPAVGLGSHVGMAGLGDGWQSLWAAGLVWALGTIAIGAVMPSPALAGAGGVLTGFLAAASYHLGANWFDQIPVDAALLERSVVAAVVVAPVLGLSGYWLRYRRSPNRPMMVAVGATVVLVALLAIIERASDAWP